MVEHFSFAVADCSKMRRGGLESYTLFRPILTVAPLSCGSSSKSEKIKFMK